MKKELNGNALLNISKEYSDINFYDDIGVFYGTGKEKETTLFDYNGKKIATEDCGRTSAYYPAHKRLFVFSGSKLKVFGENAIVLLETEMGVVHLVPECKTIVFSVKTKRDDGVEDTMRTLHFYNFDGQEVFSVERVGSHAKCTSILNKDLGLFFMQHIGLYNLGGKNIESHVGTQAVWSVSEKKEILSVSGGTDISMLRFYNKKTPSSWILVREPKEHTLCDSFGKEIRRFSYQKEAHDKYYYCFSTTSGDVIGIQEDGLWSAYHPTKSHWQKGPFERIWFEGERLMAMQAISRKCLELFVDS